MNNSKAVVILGMIVAFPPLIVTSLWFNYGVVYMGRCYDIATICTYYFVLLCVDVHGVCVILSPNIYAC